MNFFEQQDSARKNTRWLVLLFIIAVLCLIVLTNLFLVVFPWQWNSAAFSEHGANQELLCLMSERCHFWQQLNWQRMFSISLLITTVIGVVSLFKWMQVRQGGKAIAEMMGGTLIAPNTQDFNEKRLINVVEEMALAANMPVPAVYVLRHEPGINAFAAGFSSRDAVVAVTDGALKSFNRDQLQGVIAHEFSHILNGDMRLNMKLIAILHGIMFITEAGLAFLRGSRYSSRNRNNGPVLFLGLGLVVLGATGTFFGNLIKAAVSRQREFLADASAVQFTRNPSGIADALKIIGGSGHGSLIADSHGAEISHLFFGASFKRVFSLLATHPPLEQRIRRIEPRWDGRFMMPTDEYRQSSHRPQRTLRDQQMAAMIGGAAVMANATAEQAVVPPEDIDPKSMMLDKLHEPLTAAAVLLCLLHEKDNTRQQLVIDGLQTRWPELHSAMRSCLWMAWSRQDFLPVVNLAVSGLRLLSEPQYQELKRLMMQFIQADGQVDLYEWALFQLLRNSMDAHFSGKVLRREKYRHMQDIQEAVKIVLATLINAGSGSSQDKLLAWHKACNTAGIYSVALEAAPEVAMADFSKAVNRIALAFPLLKPRIIKALVDAANADGRIDNIERQTIMAVSAAIDAPLPDVLLKMLEA